MPHYEACMLTHMPRRRGNRTEHRKSADALHRLERLPLRSGAIRRLEQFSAITSLVVFGGTVVHVAFDGDAWAIIAVSWVCVLATMIVVLLLTQERRMRRLISYAMVLDKIHKIFHNARDLQSSLVDGGLDNTQAKVMLRTSVTATAEAFSIITQTPCRACIKQVHYAGPETIVGATSLRDLQVRTLIRDETTGVKAGDDSPVYVDQNSDFEQLFLPDRDQHWFVSNDLEAISGYKNSSLSWKEGHRPDYVATCVWPIQQHDESLGGPHSILGFLCVDSGQKFVFDESFDYHLGAAIADGLYWVIKLLHSRDHNVVHAAQASIPQQSTADSGGSDV